MFDALQALPPDPILGLSTAFRADERPDKIDLGVGVYKDANGHTPVMAAVKAAEARWAQEEDSKAYLPPAGKPGFLSAIETQVLGAGHAAAQAGRSRTVQTPGGCGALRLAAEFIASVRPQAKVWMSTPTWANHVPLVSAAGLAVENYPYYSAASHGVDFAAMEATLETIPAGDVVLLHGSCHNPTGADLDQAQWRRVAEIAQQRGWLPFIDSAYQGLGDGLDADAWGLRHLAASVPEVLIATSCSKNYGLYRERTGALTVVTATAAGAEIALSHLCSIARGIWSMPPSHGAAIVDLIHAHADLKQQWESELADMRVRMQSLRGAFVAATREANLAQDFHYIEQQKGMFSYLGVSPEQVDLLRSDCGVYLLRSGRINVAGISEKNLPVLVAALAKVLG